MPRTDAHHPTWRLGCGRPRIACLAVLLTSPAFGHSVAVTRGKAVADGDVLTITLVAYGHDLLHTQDLRVDADGTVALEDIHRASAGHGDSLRRSLVVRDSAGEAVDGELESWTFDVPEAGRVDLDGLRPLQMRYTLHYDIPPGGEFVSLQHRVEPRDAMFLSNIVLTVTAADLPPQTVQLTSGGNVEVVRLVPVSNPAGAHDREGPPAVGAVSDGATFVLTDAHRTVRTLLYVEDAGVRMDLFIPVGILETWQPIPRAHRDFLEAAEQERSRERIARFARAHNPLSINDIPAEARISAIDFLDVGEFGDEADPAPRRLSTLTSRVRIRIEYPSPTPLREFDLHWTLFNPAILTAHALILVDGRCFEQDISTYNPHLKTGHSIFPARHPASAQADALLFDLGAARSGPHLYWGRDPETKNVPFFFLGDRGGGGWPPGRGGALSASATAGLRTVHRGRRSDERIPTPPPSSCD
jgi:hypothetical protein